MFMAEHCAFELAQNAVSSHRDARNSGNMGMN